MPINITPKLQALVKRAEFAGFTVTADDNSITFKRGRNQFDHSMPNRGAVVVLTEAGGFDYGYRIDVPSSLALHIRTVGGVAEAIGV